MKQGRPKAFDESEVLERAMNLFWLRGYDGLGVAEILDEMGISRQSLYDTFGSKRGLFVRAIEHYRSTQLAAALALLEREGAPIDNVKDVMRFFEKLATDERCRGCLVANSIVEVGPHDAGLAEILGDTLDLLQRAIRRALERARERGELSATKSPLQLSRALTNAIMGMVVTGKLPLGRAASRDILSGTLSMLD